MPFWIRTGKCLAVTATGVRVRLRRAEHALFDGGSTNSRNEFSFGLSPDVFIALKAQVKVPGEAMVGEDVRLIERRCPGEEMEPYERLIGDALRGDRTLFGSEAGVEAAWRVVNPILIGDDPVFEYDCGSWGPSQAGQAAVEAEQKRRAAIKEQKKREAAERKEQRAQQIARRKATRRAISLRCR